MEIRTLLDRMRTTNAFANLAGNKLAQFGPDDRVYLGASLIPERIVNKNFGVESGIKYRTNIANDGGRYTPVQMKQGIRSGSFEWALGYQDIGSPFNAPDYDAMLEAIDPVNGVTDGPAIEAMAQITRWADATLLQGLVAKIELQRWQAIIAASVVRVGDDGYRETVTYPNPAGQRVTAAGTWSNNSYDPWADIIAGRNFLAAKGYRVARIISGTTAVSKLQNNTLVKQRGGVVSLAGAILVGLSGGISDVRLAEMLANDSLPAVEKYDLQYFTQTGSGYFLPRDAMVLVAHTDRDERIDLGDLEPEILFNTLGYTGIGKAAAQPKPGRVIKVFHEEKKPEGLKGEGYQASLPIIAEPEAFYVISGIA